MNEKINIKKMDGATVTADLVCFIENVATNKRYLYYTLNELVGPGEASTVKIYVSKIQQNNPTLDTPITEEDWNKLKGYMGDVLKGNNNAEIRYIPLSELKEPISVSEKAIAMPVSYDYINKQRGVYASNVAISESVTPAPSVPEPTVPLEVAPTKSEPVISETIVPVEQQAQIVAPETSTVQEIATPEPATPVASPPIEVAAPIIEPITASTMPEEEEEGNGTSTTLKPIDLATIEQKYNEMIETINKLKTQELEAAKRYNATLELSTMHKEQHANYIQNEQIKENTTEGLNTQIVEPVPSIEAFVPEPPTPTPAPISEVSTGQAIDSNANLAPVAGTAFEPTPITPVVPEPVPINPVDIETNWFDMPTNQA